MNLGALVALRKESVDRNFDAVQIIVVVMQSLSARRAWIEIEKQHNVCRDSAVALRKESVDRNRISRLPRSGTVVALRKESVDRNQRRLSDRRFFAGRSPQGERG